MVKTCSIVWVILVLFVAGNTSYAQPTEESITYLSVSRSDMTVDLFDARSGELVAALPSPFEPSLETNRYRVADVTCSNDGVYCAVVYTIQFGGSILRIVDIALETYRDKELSETINDVDWHPTRYELAMSNSLLIGSGYADSQVTFMDIEFKQLQYLELDSVPFALDWHPLGTFIAISRRATIDIYSNETLEKVTTFALAHTDRPFVWQIVWNETGNQLISVMENQVVIWSMETSTPLLAIPTDKYVYKAAWNDTSTLLSTETYDTLTVWDAVTGDIVFETNDNIYDYQWVSTNEVSVLYASGDVAVITVKD